MRYHYSSTSRIPKTQTAFRVYMCDHACYSQATLYFKNGLGLCIVQQYYDASTKRTYWSSVDDRIAWDIYKHPKFKELFLRYCKKSDNGIFPAIPVRKVMWELRMKPLPKDIWETTFDRKII